MATVNYRIKGIRETAGIKIRFKDGDNFDFEITTGLKIKREHWSKAKQKLRQISNVAYVDTVNNHLNSLKTFILGEFYIDNANGETISQVWLKNKISKYFEKPSSYQTKADIYLIPFIKRYIEESKNRDNRITGKKLSIRTIQSYETTILKLKEFEKNEGSKLKLSGINLKFHSKFTTFLIDKYNLNPNTIGGYMDNIKTFCRNAELKGLNINIELKSKGFYSPKNKTKDIYLNEDEINKIYGADLSYSQRLDNARDWLIIGVWTGLRVSDLLNLNKNNLEEDYIHVTTFKTNTPVVIAMHNQIENILEKREGEFPKVISDQKFNLYIKEVCEISGIKNLINGSKVTAIDMNGKIVHRKTNGKFPKYELVSSHICRRSFATNLYGKIGTYTIMQITGHKSEKQFLEYIKTTSSEHAQKLKDLWNKSK